MTLSTILAIVLASVADDDDEPSAAAAAIAFGGSAVSTTSLLAAGMGCGADLMPIRFSRFRFLVLAHGFLPLYV